MNIMNIHVSRSFISVEYMNILHNIGVKKIGMAYRFVRKIMLFKKRDEQRKDHQTITSAQFSNFCSCSTQCLCYKIVKIHPLSSGNWNVQIYSIFRFSPQKSIDVTLLDSIVQFFEQFSLIHRPCKIYINM